VNSLKEGFKILKTFAQVNLRYRDSRSQAEQARITLDQALQSTGSDLKPEIKPEIQLTTQAEVELKTQPELEPEIKPEVKPEKGKKS